MHRLILCIVCSLNSFPGHQLTLTALKARLGQWFIYPLLFGEADCMSAKVIDRHGVSDA